MYVWDILRGEVIVAELVYVLFRLVSMLEFSLLLSWPCPGSMLLFATMRELIALYSSGADNDLCGVGCVIAIVLFGTNNARWDEWELLSLCAAAVVGCGKSV